MMPEAVLSVVVGVAGLFQVLTGVSRLGSTLATGGVANPLFSGLESGASLMISIVAIALPLLALLVVLGLGGLALRRRRPA